MIRPFTLLCFLLACGSGLYLYQSKHRVQMLDRQIEQTVRDTNAARDKIRLLDAEWTLLNDPERLRQLADQFLALKSVQPGQFTTMAELDHRLPPVRSPDAPLEAVPEPAVMTPMVPPPVAQATPAPTPAPAGTPAAPPPVQAAQTAAAPQRAIASAQPAERQQPTERKPTASPVPASAPRTVAVSQTEARPSEPRPSVIASAAIPRPQAVIAPVRYSAPAAPATAPAPAPVPVAGGSVLGMAGRASLPPPKPIALFQPLDGH
jgi:hypothetical protein